MQCWAYNYCFLWTLGSLSNITSHAFPLAITMIDVHLNWLNWFCPLPLISGLETTIGYWILTVGNAILSHRAFLLSDKMTNTKIFEKFVWNSFFSFIEHLKWESFCTKLILTNLDWMIYWMIYTGSYLNILFLNFKLVELAQPCSSYKCYTLLRHSSNITALRLGISVAYRLGL